MPTGLEYAATFAALTIAGLVAETIRPNGRIRHAIHSRLADHEQSKEAHAAIPEVVQRLEDIDSKQDKVYHKVENIESKTDRNAYLIKQFHGDDDVSVPVEDVLDDDGDFYRGGDS